jgi:uncharacterized cupredoxin-like copper-binding protein
MTPRPTPGIQIRSRTRRVAVLTFAGLATIATSAGLGAVAAGPAGASTKTVKAVETDFHIALSAKTFKPGKYTFEAENKGQVTHALEITGPGLHNAMSKHIQPGQSTKLTVTFKKGAYDIFCPIPGHKMLGMNVNITVGESASTTSTTSHNSGSGSSGGSGSSSNSYGY